MKVFAVFVVMAIVAYASAEETTTAAAAAVEFTKTESPRIVLAQAASSPTGTLNTEIPFGLDVCMIAEYGKPLCLAKCVSELAIGGYCEGPKCWCLYKGIKPGKSRNLE